MAKKTFFPQPGDIFGRLTIVELTERRLPSGGKRGAALCRCECGNEVEVLTQNLKDRTRSCGCMKLKGSMSEAFRETRGQRPRLFSASPGDHYDRLTVIREEQRRNTEEKLIWYVVCMCDCGAETTVLASNLKSGTTRSCGCLQREHAARIGKSSRTHGLTDHPHYSRWNNVRARCDDPKNHHYKYYGARGIRMCEEWYDVAAFIAYLEAELGPCPDGHSLDRINNDGNYEPGNVRWADPVIQRHNQRRGTAWKSHDAD